MTLPGGVYAETYEQDRALVRTRGQWTWFVGLLVFLLVPEAATDEHLELLSELAELLSDTAMRESLASCDDAALVHRTLTTWEPFRPAA